MKRLKVNWNLWHPSLCSALWQAIPKTAAVSTSSTEGMKTLESNLKTTNLPRDFTRTEAASTINKSRLTTSNRNSTRRCCKGSRRRSLNFKDASKRYHPCLATRLWRGEIVIPCCKLRTLRSRSSWQTTKISTRSQWLVSLMSLKPCLRTRKSKNSE